MSRNLLAVLVVFGSVVAAADLPEKWAKRIETADSTYQQAVQTADNTRFYAVQKANATRIKAFRQALTDATKAGDFDAATAIKERVAAAEKGGAPKDKPKGTVKFAGHEYAVIPDKVTWHIAKRLCEEMGGHLATIQGAAENQGLLEMCKASGSEPWIGATDEVAEGQWRWVDGSQFTTEIHQDNANDIQHYLTFHAGLGTWDDGDGGARHSFVCEWD